MPRPARRGATADREERDAVEGRQEDPRSILAERLIADRSLLHDIEVVYEHEESSDVLDRAADASDEAAAERAAEAERLIHVSVGGEEDPLTPETLEDVLEPFPTPTDETLHEVEPLLETLLDEGTPLDDADADAFEAEIAGGAWRDYVD